MEQERNPIVLPEQIERRLTGKAYTADKTGMSKARVLIFDDCVLKIAPYEPKNEETVEVMRWLAGKLPVPEVLCYERDETHQFLLMSRLKGKMACDPYYLERPKELIRLLAETIRMLWSVDTADCPRRRDPEYELQEARFRVEHNLVDVNNVEPETFGEGGFRDPAALLAWLENNRPSYEPVLSHGDLCLPNILIDRGRIGGLIDLGETGIGDKWRDLALCCRSLRRNAQGAFGGKVYPNAREELLMEALGVARDAEKIRYYLLLDELF